MLEKLQEIIAEQLGIEAEEVQAESNFKDDLNADSLDLFEMIMAMEEEFGVEIPSDDLDAIATVQDVMDYLKNKGVED
ncbi:MAG: acyl carrier protein [Lachnospiraceae bacterium]|nr:acyl carrier protein [Lachnospiraceae bacterium]